MSLQYRLFGLNIQMPFVDAILAPAQGEVDVVISLVQNPPYIKASQQQFILNVQGVATYYIEHGQRIAIKAYAGASSEKIRLYLLGSAMGCLLHQRRLLVLHGCAVAFKSGIVVFVADSGTGKSTLAANFYRHQYPVYGDDQTVINVKQELQISPGLAQIKLWQTALDEQEIDNKALHKVHQDFDKYIYPIQQHHLQPRPLIAVVDMCIGEKQTFVERHGFDKAQTLVKHTYRHQYLVNQDLIKSHFENCTAVANNIAVYGVTRPQQSTSSFNFFNFIVEQLQLQGIEQITESIKV